ncbi:NAD(P)H dehydrogenase [Devosia limi DSM 17137]|uniref:NAD(P)H dehydrogenase n=1 Tax=Devosia limi DSM 17137 TaxID=1121477 RepID=A0A0F5L1P1_9HYPH|nr:NAD(P)H-dependent oxidoreductase [Devosia limi]KKB76341.1 NAD(P)H dehydrogenase [Devosia limi DSM 17137]SHF72660.1 Putative NADPH-quinone reductase (modulator of drug activity B) [Devosia limi DSM 17137]
MQALLVLAHPLRDSLCAHLAGVTATALQQRGASVDVLDLYAEGFDPLLSASERTNHYGTPAPTPDIIAQQARLAAADVLVLVFPTWWFAVPAILKGWFDRVWAPGFAYDHGTPITPRLTRLKSCLVVTTLGSPWWIDRLVMRRPVRTMLKSALLGACAPQARFQMLSLHGAEAVDADQLARFETRLANAIARL